MAVKEKKRFYKHHPDIYPRPSLKEQIVALEEKSGLIAGMIKDRLYIEIDTTTNPEYPSSERVLYNLKHSVDPALGVVKWVLEHDGAWYLLETQVERPELKEIVITQKETPYRGVKVDKDTYWTDNEHDHAALKVAVDTLARAQRKIVELIGED
jgi:hypothetical protein